MYQALLAQGGSLQTYPSTAFNFGTGDFTVMAMVQSTSGGTVVARKGTAGGAGNGGFLLVVNPDGSIKFATDDGSGYYQVLTGATSVLDGDCHTVAGIRSGATLEVLLDGLTVVSTPSGNASPPLNVDNNLPLTIGCTQQSQEPHNQFVGGVMNASIWNAALTGVRIVKAAFARITASERNLQGYWTLDATGDDLSTNANPANIVGRVTFQPCLCCVWAEAANAYTFCQISNMPGSNAPAMTVSLGRELNVPAGAPALAFAIMADQDVPAFPVGAQVRLTDPAGRLYGQDENTDTLFAVTDGGQLWGLMAVSPAPGTWRVKVTAPASTAFNLTINTIPSADVVASSRMALDPLVDGPQLATEMIAGTAPGGFWDAVAALAVAAVVGVIAAGAVVLSGGAALPALLAGVVAFTGVGVAKSAAALPSIAASNNLPNSTTQVVGMAGFVVAADKLLLMDANVAADPATQLTYAARNKVLYPAVTASTFNKVQTQLVGSQMKLNPVRAAMSGFGSGYVSASGHGKPSYLLGWYVSGNSGPMQEVIATDRAAKFTPAQAKGKIIHFFACNCGYMGTSTAPGLGRAMVAGGAIAFFGYNEPYKIVVRFSAAFCAPDIEIDLQMIRGNTCAQAYTASFDKYTRTINNLRAQGEMNAAAALESNRDALVSPSTDPAYGNAAAMLT